MTKIWNFLNWPRVMFWHAMLWLTIDLIYLGNNAHLTKSDWASWVQAVGSIGAILGAIWISNQARRSAKEDARTLAVVAAVDLLRQARSSKKVVESAIEILDKNEQYNFPSAELKRAHRLIDGIEHWTSSSIGSVLALENGCAMSLARAQFLIAAAKQEIDQALSRQNLDMLHALRFEAAINAREFLRQASVNLQSAVSLLNQAARPAEPPAATHF